jgi:hypothetical protein
MRPHWPASRPRPTRPRQSRTPGLLLAPLFLAACADAGSTDTGGASVVDSAGVRVVTSAADRIDRPLDRSLETPAHLRLGVVEGDEALQFFTPNGAARLSDGRLVVSESGTRIRLFDGDGRFVRWIGAVGEGPREFAVVTSMGVLDGDTIAVYDARRRRIVLFEPGGAFVRESLIELPAGFPFPQVRSSRFLPDGRLFLEGRNLGVGLPDAEGRVERVAAVFLDRNGANPEVVDEADGMTSRIETVGVDESGQVMRILANVTPTFHPLTRFTGVQGGVYRWDGARFEVRRLDDAGGLREIVRVDRPARPVTADIIRSWREEGPGANVAPPLQELRDRMLASMQFADSLPHFQVVEPASDGTLWLGEFVGHVGGTPVRWWRISPEGQLEGFLDLPEGFRVLAFEDGEVLGVERDELEVPFVVGYRIR